MTTLQHEPSARPAAHLPRPRHWLLVTGSLLWLLVLAAVFFIWRNRADRTPVDQQGSPSVAKTASRFTPYNAPDFTLTERSGRKVSKKHLQGRPWAVCFIFSQCAFQCGRISERMNRLQSDLAGRDVKLVSITVDPEFDTPERLRRYAEVFGAKPGQWLFLTGDKQKIHQLAAKGFQVSVKEHTGKDRKPGFEVTHSRAVLHVDAGGLVVGKYDGTSEADMSRLGRAIEQECERLKRSRRKGR